MSWFESRQGNGRCAFQYVAVFLNFRIYEREASALTDMSEVCGIFGYRAVVLVDPCNRFRTVSIPLQARREMVRIQYTMKDNDDDDGITVMREQIPVLRLLHRHRKLTQFLQSCNRPILPVAESLRFTVSLTYATCVKNAYAEDCAMLPANNDLV